MAYDIGVLVRFERGGLDAIDRVRGDVPRTAWIRRRCEEAVLAHDALAAPKAAVVESAREAVPPFVPGGAERPIIQKRR